MLTPSLAAPVGQALTEQTNALAVEQSGRTSVVIADLDQSHDLIAVLDIDGTIIHTNAAWQAAADRRGGSSATSGCGANYLEVCERSDASAVAQGIRSVLRGERPRFEFDYPSHSALEDAWFALEVSALSEPPSGAVVTHTDVTARTRASRNYRRGSTLDPVTMLATSVAGLNGLAQMLAYAQSHESSLAVVTVTMSDLVDIESCHGRRSRDELVVHVVARVLRLTRSDDAMIRTSTNQLILFASVADAQGGEFLRGRIADVLVASHLVGAAAITCRVDVAVVSSDRFSSIDSLLHGFGTSSVGKTTSSITTSTRAVQSDLREAIRGGTDIDEAVDVPMAVYSLRDGLLQTANEAARSMFGMGPFGQKRWHAPEVDDSMDLRDTIAALAALGAGATDSYRAQRTLMTTDGPMDVLTFVRRMAIDSGDLAVVLAVPARLEDAGGPAREDPFATALVGGTIDAYGAVGNVAVTSSAMESELISALTETLRHAAHPDEAGLVDRMLESMRLRGSACGSFRVLHSGRGWVVCRCQLFSIKQRPIPESDTDASVVANESYAFVLSADISTKSMADKIARLEGHIRRIGAEIHAADLELTVRPSVDRNVTRRVDSLTLTARQRDIVERLARGQRVPSIAAALFISRSTVRNHLAQVYRLVGVHSQEELLVALQAAEN